MAAVAAIPIPAFRCPSDPGPNTMDTIAVFAATPRAITPGGNREAALDPGEPSITATTNYVSCTGSATGTYYDLNRPTDGVFSYEVWHGLEQLTDGTSNVIIFSETILGDGSLEVSGSAIGASTPPDPMQPWTRSGYSTAGQRAAPDWLTIGGLSNIEETPDIPSLLVGTSTWVGWRGSIWLSARPYATQFSTYSPPNPPYADWGARNAFGFHAARSFHRGGVLATKADGSVIFVSNNAHRQVWQDMGKAASGSAKGL